MTGKQIANRTPLLPDFIYGEQTAELDLWGMDHEAVAVTPHADSKLRLWLWYGRRYTRDAECAVIGAIVIPTIELTTETDADWAFGVARQEDVEAADDPDLARFMAAYTRVRYPREAVASLAKLLPPATFPMISEIPQPTAAA